MPAELGALRDLAAVRGVSLSAVIHQILSSALRKEK